MIGPSYTVSSVARDDRSCRCADQDEGGAPVFFCACRPAWGGDFCQEARDPCSAGLPDCGSMFRCHRDETNTLAGFSCRCHERLGWAPRSASDPRCMRITRCSDGNPCQNGGACRQEEGGFVCVCTERSSGDLCERRLVDGSEDPAAPASAAAATSAPDFSPLMVVRSFDQMLSPYGSWQQPAVRPRRSHAQHRRQRSRHRHRVFLERLLRDVEPQIRRTARDSIVELPHR
ncbi:fibropellin-1-like [Pollicipes pollicipes]|uniref:fibropellin-1-like n=1 Tax=Pollicipes pollicipes TaxID=41117 RepID=UPI00188584AC|nr:fibropellin-1-like [Pollicipes pollicipes]